MLDSDHDVGEGCPVDEDVIDRAPDRPSIDSEATGRIALWIEVDDEDPVSGEGEISGEIHHRRRLSDAAFLVGAGDCLAHSVPRSDVIHARSFYQNRALQASTQNGCTKSWPAPLHVAALSISPPRCSPARENRPLIRRIRGPHREHGSTVPAGSHRALTELSPGS